MGVKNTSVFMEIRNKAGGFAVTDYIIFPFFWNYIVYPVFPSGIRGHLRRLAAYRKFIFSFSYYRYIFFMYALI